MTALPSQSEPRPRYRVEARRGWSDRWRAMPRLFPAAWTEAVAPQMPVAYFAWDAGDLVQAGAETYRNFFGEDNAQSWLNVSARLSTPYATGPPNTTRAGTR